MRYEDRYAELLRNFYEKTKISLASAWLRATSHYVQKNDKHLSR